ncbi:MAG: UDP-N-acetylglucosamine--N-acetylmuramyl-(pentapeptide) pyrophosphoryl-undecaprenol N-acetylglucosamine transferase, partial [Verrucomicrobia bacterium]|nr:UDP-N-acetylglucosamine--N-acetylmuramyl-(pentapeptide) pyrophosphoryl-undecaprenol N-acetylglucosamine transferase [Verrucomicrobiota bacterium]
MNFTKPSRLLLEMSENENTPRIAIACGGTGGHLFPGLALGQRLKQAGARVLMLVSEKKIDSYAVTGADIDVAGLPAIGLSPRRLHVFSFKLAVSFYKCLRLFGRFKPDAVMAMGGFTSAPAVLAGKVRGAAILLHEGNSIPGRANRLLARMAGHVLVYFPGAAGYFRHSFVHRLGFPVRSEFFDHTRFNRASVAAEFGLDAEKPIVLVMGGSQGARPINKLMIDSLPLIRKRLPDAQFIHISGFDREGDESMSAAYAKSGVRACVREFIRDSGAVAVVADVAVSRAGASSLAEFAAAKLPALLIPFPHAADNHQYSNAMAFSEAGAALMLEQNGATPEEFVGRLELLLGTPWLRENIREALGDWCVPDASDRIAGLIQGVIREGNTRQMRPRAC